MALAQKRRDFERALERLTEACEQSALHQDDDTYAFFRDSTIQRFEFTLEIAWKSIKTFLLEHEGITCRSPKGCVRDFLNAGYMNEVSISQLLEMIDDRNLATHTYHESLADEIFGRIDGYCTTLRNILDFLEQTGKTP
jgi:nucleotidyltransferase substrate binding protein (TIGR01987 family)